MASKHFIDKDPSAGLIDAAWANEVDALVHDIFQASTTLSQVKVLLAIDLVENGAEVNPTAAEILTALLTVDVDESGLNASTLKSAAPDAAATVNTIAKRDANADLLARTFNMSLAADGTNPTHVIVEFNNGYLQRQTKASFISNLGLAVTASPDFTGQADFDTITEKQVSTTQSTSYSINLNTATVFEITMTGNVSLTFANVPASGKAVSITLILKHSGAGRTPSFPASVKWPGGTAPTWGTAAGNEDIVTLFTYDGGTVFRANLVGQNYA